MSVHRGVSGAAQGDGYVVFKHRLVMLCSCTGGRFCCVQTGALYRPSAQGDGSVVFKQGGAQGDGSVVFKHRLVSANSYSQIAVLICPGIWDNLSTDDRPRSSVFRFSEQADGRGRPSLR